MNTNTLGYQQDPSVARLASGLVVTWRDQSEARGRFFSSTGTPQASEMRFDTDGVSDSPLVARAGSTFVVTWNRSFDVIARRFTAAGSPLGAEFRVNAVTSSANPSLMPAVAGGPGGDFAVVWSKGPFPERDIYIRRFDSSGVPQGGDLRVNTYTPVQQQHPRIARGTDYVVVWDSGDGEDEEVFGQRFSSTLAPIGGEFVVNSSTTGLDSSPDVTITLDGGFQVVWNATGNAGNHILTRRFLGDGTPLFESHLDGDHLPAAFPSIAMDDDGRSALVWYESLGGDAVTDIFGRLYDPSGQPITDRFRVNTYTSSTQGFPVVAALGPARFLVLWNSTGQDGDKSSVWARVVCLKGDANGDIVVNVSDVLYLINNLFAGGPDPVGCSGDVNADGQVNVTDVLYLINYLFAGGPAPL